MAKLFNYYRYENVFEAKILYELLLFCEKNQSKFKEAEVGNNLNRTIRKDYRVCLINENLEEFQKIFEDKVKSLMDDILIRLQIKPFEIDSFTTQIAAHGNGAFYKPHIDTHTNHENKNKNRIISAVYYFFNEPKNFSGGELVLHPFDFLDGDDKIVQLAPINNSLIVFPSFGLHEVYPVNCPTSSYMDFRFAINCWVNKA